MELNSPSIQSNYNYLNKHRTGLFQKSFKIIISRVLRSLIILNRTRKTVLYNPVLVFLIYLHQTHHAPKDAELSLKKILFYDIANKNETIEKLQIRKAITLIIAEWAESKLINQIYVIVLFVQIYFLIYIFIIFFFIWIFFYFILFLKIELSFCIYFRYKYIY